MKNMTNWLQGVNFFPMLSAGTDEVNLILLQPYFLSNNYGKSVCDKSLCYFDRILSEMGIDSTPINTKSFETLVKLVSSISCLNV